jgi:hypothetical protein
MLTNTNPVTTTATATAALASGTCDVRPLAVADRASSPTRRYRAVA